MQKDIAKGHESEIQGLLFDMIALGEKMDVDKMCIRDRSISTHARMLMSH